MGVRKEIKSQSYRLRGGIKEGPNEIEVRCVRVRKLKTEGIGSSQRF